VIGEGLTSLPARLRRVILHPGTVLAIWRRRFTAPSAVSVVFVGGPLDGELGETRQILWLRLTRGIYLPDGRLPRPIGAPVRLVWFPE
jgi:hypothetical protein